MFVPLEMEPPCTNLPVDPLQVDGLSWFIQAARALPDAGPQHISNNRTERYRIWHPLSGVWERTGSHLWVTCLFFQVTRKLASHYGLETCSKDFQTSHQMAPQNMRPQCLTFFSCHLECQGPYSKYIFSLATQPGFPKYPQLCGPFVVASVSCVSSTQENRGPGGEGKMKSCLLSCHAPVNPRLPHPSQTWERPRMPLWSEHAVFDSFSFLR